MKTTLAEILKKDIDNGEVVTDATHYFIGIAIGSNGVTVSRVGKKTATGMAGGNIARDIEEFITKHKAVYSGAIILASVIDDEHGSEVSKMSLDELLEILDEKAKELDGAAH